MTTNPRTLPTEKGGHGYRDGTNATPIPPAGPGATHLAAPGMPTKSEALRPGSAVRVNRIAAPKGGR